MLTTITTTAANHLAAATNWLYSNPTALVLLAVVAGLVAMGLTVLDYRADETLVRDDDAFLGSAADYDRNAPGAGGAR